METRILGRTGLRVSVLSFGTMTFGGRGTSFYERAGGTGLDEARRLVDACIDAGVNLFDTADIYSFGLSEEILGRALEAKRERVLVATKLNARTSDDPNDVGQSRHHIVRACEASLRRLGTDWIDLYQVHGFDGLTALDESLRALDDLVRAGKVRAIGCSNYSAWHLMKALGISEQLGLTRYASLQAYYNLVARELEHELVPLCLDQSVGVLVWSPLASGFLSGKYRRGQEGPPGARASAFGPPAPVDEEQGYDIVELLVEIAAARGATPAQVALNWRRRRPGVASVVVGARTAEQLADNLAAAAWTLSDEEVERLDRVSARPLPYPYWHQVKFNAERLHERSGGV